MIRFDYHLHSTHSFDGQATLLESATRAREIGLTEICFTDHHELVYPPDQDALKHIDLPAYLEDLAKLQEQVPEITIKRGIETGIVPGSLEMVAEDLGQYDFDFIIAAQHAVGDKDPYMGDYYDDKGLREGQQLYLEEIFTCIDGFEEFDVIAHIGYADKYLSKYPQFDDPQPFEWSDFPDLIDSILKSAIHRGKGIEVNTSNYSIYDWPTPHPSIIKRYVELGGEVMTVGSDAHVSEDVGFSFDKTAELLRECGVRYLCTYTKRKPKFHKF